MMPSVCILLTSGVLQTLVVLKHQNWGAVDIMRGTPLILWVGVQGVFKEVH